MSRSVKTLRCPACILALGFVVAPVTDLSGHRCSLSAQGTCASAPQSQRSWPRWKGAPAPTGGALAVQNTVFPSSDGVFVRSALGAATGWVLGLATGVAFCRQGCGELAVLGPGMAGAWLGSAILGCTAAHERGCTMRVLPGALLGTLAATAASVVVGSATHDGITALVTFSVVQGLLTTMTIR